MEHMRGWYSYALTILFVTFCACIVFWVKEPSLQQQIRRLFVPVPISYALPLNNQVATLDIWGPPANLINTTGASIAAISAQSALVYDLTSQKPLFVQDATTRLPLASLTKIMTAIVALEHQRADDTYVVTDADLVGEDSMGLDSGEKLSLSELLYGLILHSGNDAAETLASNFPTGRAGFIEAMNAKVATLGLFDTHFTNPTGLEGDGDQYTTAHDLLVMTRYALIHFPLFRDVVATFDYDIPATDTHKEYFLENETNLLTSYPGVKGVKTGYTPEAGLCLVTYLDYGGHQIIGVILNSSNRRDDMKELLDYSLRKVGVTPPLHG